MSKYTVFFEQVNRTNFQVQAKDKFQALDKAIKLYKQKQELPQAYVQESWICPKDGEDKLRSKTK